MPAPADFPRWTRREDPPVLGVVMIVKNEGTRLPALFEEIALLADEVVVVDTGSTDDTVRVCETWGVRVISRPWRNDFSYARNEALANARAPFLLWLDGDDRVPPDTARGLAALRDGALEGRPSRAYSLLVHNVDECGHSIDSFRQVRVLPNRQEIRYRGVVHESFMESLEREGVRVHPLDLDLLHTGYATPEENRAKAQRNLDLLREEIRRDPSDVHAQVHLAQALSALDRPDEAVRLLDAVIQQASRVAGQTRIRAELFVARGRYRRQAKDELGAAHDFDEARTLWPEWGVARTLRAEIAAGKEEWETVASILQEGGEPAFEAGAFGYPLARLESTHLRLRAELLSRAGEPEQTEPLLKRALDLHPGNVEARLALGQLHLHRREFARAREVLEPLGDDPAAMGYFPEVCASIGLARAGTGDWAGAASCLSPLVELLAEILPSPEHASPGEVAAALERVGRRAAAGNMAVLAGLAACEH